MRRLTLFKDSVNLVKELKSTMMMEGCSKPGPHVAPKSSYVNQSIVHLYHPAKTKHHRLRVSATL